MFNRMAKIRAYEADLKLQRIRMNNLKVMRGEKDKERTIVKKMGHELEKVGSKEQEKQAWIVNLQPNIR